MVSQTKYCCCGCSMQTGAILIGTYQLIRGLLGILSDIYLVWSHFPYIMGVLGVLKMIIALLLIVGAKKEHPRLVFWWGMATAVLTATDAVSFPLEVITFFPDVIQILALGFGLVDLLLDIYFLWEVYCYYRILVQKDTATALQTV